jgi:hypothetical protein
LLGLFTRVKDISRTAGTTNKRERGNAMKTYEVNITITSNGQARVKATSLKEAWKQANNLTIGDYEMIDGSEDKVEIVEVSV